MNRVKEIEDELKNRLKEALVKAISEENLKIDPEKLPEIEVEVPREKEHGDYATNLALVLSGVFKKSPGEIAALIVKNFDYNLVKDINIAGPGFINFKLKSNWLYETVEEIIELGHDYGRIDLGKEKSILIEFVSANPTGPLHVGHSRGAVVGDVLANILKTAGYKVDKEYYINDAGNQMEILGHSTLIRYKQECGLDKKMPEDYYSGDYLIKIARELKEQYERELLTYPEKEQLQICKNYTYKKMLNNIKKDLRDFGIEFDNWFSEKQLHKGKIQEVIKLLKDKGYIYEKEDAIWFKASSFFDGKDRVVIKSDGTPTYLAADIAYHYDKLKRGYDKLINIWGADHHGYIPRMKSVIRSLGYEEEYLETIIVQMVTLLRDGKKISMSKRSGNFITMTDVLQEVGRDAARYFYIMRSADSHLDFDIDLAKEQSTNNPVYYIQYAHARIHSIMENAEEEDSNNYKLNLLKEEEEIDLLKLLARYPEEIRISAVNRQVHHITVYAYELANAFHVFYNKCRVITEDKQLTASRIFLVKAVRNVLKNVLSILGIKAPEEM